MNTHTAALHVRESVPSPFLLSDNLPPPAPFLCRGLESGGCPTKTPHELCPTNKFRPQELSACAVQLISHL